MSIEHDRAQSVGVRIACGIDEIRVLAVTNGRTEGVVWPRPPNAGYGGRFGARSKRAVVGCGEEVEAVVEYLKRLFFGSA